jgi:hypothetical protein
MHTRALRPLEHSRTAPRRFWTLTRNAGANGITDGISRDGFPKDVVAASWWTFDHSASTLAHRNQLGIVTEQFDGTLTDFPFLESMPMILCGSDITRDSFPAGPGANWQGAHRLSYPMGNAEGRLQLTRAQSTFTTNGALLGFRPRLPTDTVRVVPRPVPFTGPPATTVRAGAGAGRLGRVAARTGTSTEHGRPPGSLGLYYGVAFKSTNILRTR